MAPVDKSKEKLKQQTLAGFFTKPPASTSSRPPSSSSGPPSSSAPQKAATKPAAKSSTKTPKPAQNGTSKSKSQTATNDITDEDEEMEDAEAPAPASVKPQRKSKTKSVTSAPTSDAEDVSMASSRPASSNGDEEQTDGDGGATSSRGRKLTKRRVIIDDSDDSDAASNPSSVAPKSKPKKRARYSGDSEDEEFSVASSAASGAAENEDSDDYFDDDLDISKVDIGEASAASSSPQASSIKKVKGKAAPKAKRPAFKKKGSSVAGGGDGAGGVFKTTAERQKEEEKEDAKTTTSPWDFLKNVRDADGNPRGSENYDSRTLYISKKDWATMTPFEVQFWEIKKNHFDTILFFQKGKFAELYEEDAMIGHQHFDLKITKRVKMSMVGVPETSVDFWISKFLARGYKVGRVEQCETALGAEMRNKGTLKGGKAGASGLKAKNGREIVRRELKSVLTNGTITDGMMLTDDEAQCLLAIKESIDPITGLPTIGLVMLDASTAQFDLSHFTDDTTRRKLETVIRKCKPKELVHEKGNLSTSTLRLLRHSVNPECVWTSLKPGTEFLGKEDCLEELQGLLGGEVPDVVTGFYEFDEAMEALGGLMWYLKQLNLDKQLFTAKNFNIYDPIRKGETLQLDGQTLSHIEVLVNSQGTEEGTLLQLLTRTVTPFGKRLFRTWLCAPLQSIPAINDRLDAVEDLMAHPEFEKHFDGLGRSIPDLERLISRVHAGHCTIKNFRLVLKAFHKISKAFKALSVIVEDGFKSKGIAGLLRSAPDLDGLLENVEGMFTGDESELIPHEGRDELYDAALAEVREAEEALNEEMAAAKKLLKCKDLIFRDIGIKDIYQIQVPAKIKVPQTWTKMSGTKEVNRYYSPKSEKLVKTLKEAREKQTAATSDFNLRVFEEFDTDYSTWLQAIRLVAELDCLCSLAKSSVALGEHACRPQFVESPAAFLDFDELRHPCVITTATDADFIPNDVKMGTDDRRMVLLTGPNMAGKSTLLRMTCAAVICAQLGCYVAATKAVLSPVDKLLSRMGAQDSIFANASTFKVEMDDARKILTESTPRSLVILDELGRGTSTYDGHAIAFAVLHRLATHIGCIGYFATHYSTLNDDFATSPNIRHGHMLTNVDEETREVIFLYKFADGAASRSYGPHVARMAGVKREVVERAISISKDFEEQSKVRQLQSRSDERLSLCVQADAAWLLNVARNNVKETRPAGEVLATMASIMKAVKALQLSPK